MTPSQPKPLAAFRKQVLALLGESYGDKTLVLCPTVFVRLLNGDHKAAILLSQLLYWGDRTKDPAGWFYKSYTDWQLETGLSEAQVRRIVNGDPRVRSAQVTLRDLGVETVLKKVKHTGAPTLHYRINHERFLAVLHAFMGQGDPQQCSGSIPSVAQDEPLTESAMNSDQRAGSLILAETTTKEYSAEDQGHQSPTHHPNEDSDLAIFIPFEARFRNLKDQDKETLRAELARLGADKVKEVTERCATHGARSWAYVCRALANESAASAASSWDAVPQEGGALTQGAGSLAFDSESGRVQRDAPDPAPVASERVKTPWYGFRKVDGTVQDAWSAAFHQLEQQLDRANFETWLRNTTLVDYEPETHTFVVVARNQYACDMLQHKLYRMIRRLLRDVVGQPADARFVLREDWLARAGQGAAA